MTTFPKTGHTGTELKVSSGTLPFLLSGTCLRNWSHSDEGSNFSQMRVL